MMKRILSFFLTVALSAALLAPAASAANEAAASKDTDWLYITIDPGHGGDGAGGYDPGAINSTYGYQEADRVLRIGLYLKQELETYRHVHVDMTRSDRDGTYYTAPLSKVQRRVDFAQQKGSDLLVSLHLNGAATQSAHGALILASNGNYDAKCADIVDGVGTNILTQLGKLGLDTSRGLVKESSHDGTTYPNGKLADYYGIVRYGQLAHIPSLIIEHCFISSDSDSAQFLSSEAKLQAMAQADARGIAAYYGLEKKTEGETDPEPAFRDCRKHWAREYVDTAAAAGWVAGVGNGLFAPDDALTRGMFVTMLARLAGVNQADYPDSRFSDVEASAWYAPSVSWAASKGIVSGVGDGKFEPNRNITRQEMAVMFYGMLFGTDSILVEDDIKIALGAFKDGDTVASWAREAVAVCYISGIMVGDNGSFKPTDLLSRAQLAQVFRSFYETQLTFVLNELPAAPDQPSTPEQPSVPEQPSMPTAA